MMKPARRSLLRFVNARTCQLAIAFDRENDRALTRGDARKRGLVDQVNRSLFWIFDHRSELATCLQQTLVNLSRCCLFSGKVRFDRKSVFVHNHWSPPLSRTTRFFNALRALCDLCGGFFSELITAEE